MKFIDSKAEFIKQQEGLEGIYKQIELSGRTCYKSEDKITEDSAKGFVERMIKSGHCAMLEHGTIYLYLEATPSNIFKKVEHPNIRFTAPYGWGDVVGAIRARYDGSPYSKSFSIYEGNTRITAVTTNLRVIVENHWEDDLKFLSSPTKYHEKRYTIKVTTDQGVMRELTRHRSCSFAIESTRYCNYSKDKFGNELTFINPSWDMTLGDDSYGEDKSLMFLFKNIETEYNHLINDCGWKPQQARMILPLATKCDVIMTGFESDWKHFMDLRYYGTTGKPHPDMLLLATKIKEEFNNNKINF